MIPRVETILDSMDEVVLGFFKPEDSEILKDLLMCPIGAPVEKYHKWYVMSPTLAPAHVQWLKEDLDEWAIVEHVPAEGFCFWFTSESDAVSFERSFK